MVQHENTDKSGKFYISEDGKQLAEITYVWAGRNKIVIEHTEVNELLKGKGAGKQMLVAAVEFARNMKIKILPLCPFAKSVFDKTPEFKDVLF